ncbi:hypothetical protein [Bosea caraganae]|uniref:hypothetical protein n=1 Tax=Bosea caraganae TaxID=2763117 RepID=UPI0011C03905|nr:hypothetical protein [Bosea caraganae]
MKMPQGDAGFVCRKCGSPSIELPTPITEEALVMCGRCREVIGSWLDYKRTISRSIRSAGGNAVAWSADPIIDLAVSMQKR